MSKTTNNKLQETTTDIHINVPEFLVVIGASAGGLNTLTEMVRSFPINSSMAYCIVLHLSRTGIGDFIVHRLKTVTDLECSLAKDGETLQKNHIYIAPPNSHLLVKDHMVVLGAGPEENRFRPSIDVLFRSAAVAYNSHAVGIVLTGLLNDGTSGMMAIKRSGGTSIVQDPNEAEFPDMPLSVINHMEVDHVVKVEMIGPLITRLAQNGSLEQKTVPHDLRVESSIAEKVVTGIGTLDEIGDKSVFSCPDCGGSLWTIKNEKPKRYRCHIGHAYTEKDLAIKQSETMSATLWMALRMMEERKYLLKKMEDEHSKKGYKTLSFSNAEKQAELQGHIETLKYMLKTLQENE